MKKNTNPREQSRTAASLLAELRDYERAGAHLYLEERRSRPVDIVRACMLAEETNYMRDFVSDESDHITEIHFIKI